MARTNAFDKVNDIAWSYSEFEEHSHFKGMVFISKFDQLVVFDSQRLQLVFLHAENGELARTVNLPQTLYWQFHLLDCDEEQNKLALVHNTLVDSFYYEIDLTLLATKDQIGYMDMNFKRYQRTTNFPLKGFKCASGYIPGLDVADGDSNIFLSISHEQRTIELFTYPEKLGNNSDLRRFSHKQELSIPGIHQPFPATAVMVPGGRFLITEQCTGILYAFSSDGKLAARLLTHNCWPGFGLAFDEKRGRILYNTQRTVWAIEANSWLPCTLPWAPDTHFYSTPIHKRITMLLALIRRYQLESSWSLIPNELFFIVLQHLAGY